MVTAVKVAVGLGLLAAVVWTNRDQIREVFSHKIQGWHFAFGFVLYSAGLVLAFVRWGFYVHALDVPIRLHDALRIGFIANLFNFIVPGGPVGGDVVRAALLCREHPEWKTQAIASVVLDRLVGLLALCLLGCAGGSLAWDRIDAPVRRLVVISWGAAGVVTALIALGFSPALYRPLAKRFAHRTRLARRLDALVATGTAYRARLHIVVLGLGGAILTHSLIILSFHQAGLALYPVVPTLAEHFLIVPLVLVSTALPLPFGALGLSEGLSAHLFGLANFRGGAVAMMGFRVLQYGTAVLSTVVILGSLRQARTLAQESAQFVDEAQPIDSGL
jgi:uncharacterized membrane protein YbhN (UPF0104 family)